MRFLFEARLACARALAITSGASAVLGALGRDVSWIWLGLGDEIIRSCALVLLSVSAWWVSASRDGRRGHEAARGALLVLSALSAFDVLSCVRAMHSGRLYALTPVPFSAVLSLLCLVLAVTRSGPIRPSKPIARAFLVAGLVVALLGVEIEGVAFTDYRRPADAIVVLGARVYANGAPSEALEQRMSTACQLYAKGYAPLVIVSGGQGREGPAEPVVMRNLALACGVPDRAIVIDDAGIDTHATASSTARIARERSLRTVIAVSHGYHLARVGLALRRAGVHAVTVPAREPRLLRGKPYFVARELAAYALYAVGVTPA